MPRGGFSSEVFSTLGALSFRSDDKFTGNTELHDDFPLNVFEAGLLDKIEQLQRTAASAHGRVEGENPFPSGY